MAQDKSPGWFDLSSRPFAKLRVVRLALTMTEVSCDLLIESFSGGLKACSTREEHIEIVT